MPCVTHEMKFAQAVPTDDRSGTVIATYDPRSAPMLNRIDDAAYPIHMGLPGACSRCWGVELPIFFVTGLTLWLRKRRGRTKVR